MQGNKFYVPNKYNKKINILFLIDEINRNNQFLGVGGTTITTRIIRQFRG